MRPISIHTGAWRYPGAVPDANFNFPVIRRLAQRLEAAKLLLNGSTYDQIVKAVEISTATISRINRCIQYGSGGYRDTIEKVQKAAKPE